MSRHHPASTATLAGLAVLFAAAMLGPVLAADDPPAPSPAEGQALAQKFCATCHFVGGEPTGTAPVGPPSFAAIANKPGQSGGHIKAVLIKPHAPMPDMSLTNEEILNVIAYLDTLRKDRSGPSLLPGGSTSKPDYPEPT